MSIIVMGTVAASFSGRSVADAASLEKKGSSPGAYLVKTGGLNADGVVLKAGGACNPGEFIKFMRCTDEKASSCTSLFNTFWEKSNADDLLYYKDYFTKELADFYGTYECYQETTVAPAAPTGAPQPTAPAKEPTPAPTPVNTPAPTASGSCDITVKEGAIVKVAFETEDPDSDQLTTTFDFMKLNSKMKKKGNVFEWQTVRGDAGKYNFEAATTDGEFTSTTEGCIEVLAVNTPPTVKGATNLEVKQGESVTLAATCSDTDGDATTITYTGWMMSKSKTPGASDVGDHDVTITCADSNGAKASKTVTITVIKVNRKPLIRFKQVA